MPHHKHKHRVRELDLAGMRSMRSVRRVHPREVTSLKEANDVSLGDGLTGHNFDVIYDTFFNRVQGDQLAATGALAPANLVTVIMAAMQLMEQLGHADAAISGAAKKILVLRIVERLIEHVVVDENKRQVLLTLLSQMGPVMIDGIIAADHGELLNRGASGCASLFSLCTSKKQ